MALVNLRGAEYDNQMIRNFPQSDIWKTHHGTARAEARLRRSPISCLFIAMRLDLKQAKLDYICLIGFPRSPTGSAGTLPRNMT
jgi:hypothetical protein